MRKYYAVFFILCSFFFYSNAQAQDLIGGFIKATQEAEKERIKNAPKLAPTLIPEARNQSRLGSYLVEQLTIQSQDPETNKRTARKIRSDIKKIERDLNRLDAGISEWEGKVYSKKLDKLMATFSKHTKKYNNIVSVELERIAEAERAEQERIAAAKRAEEARIAAEQAKLAAELEAYKARCEPASASDDPFASFNTSEEPRMDIVLDIGSAKMKLQATKNGGCMWLGNYNRPEAIPALLIEESYLQNPNVKTQYILNITEGDKTGIASITPNMNFNISTTGSFMLDFENYECSLRRKGGSQIKISCNDGIIVRKRLTDVKNIVNASCDVVRNLAEQNTTAFIQHYGAKDSLMVLAECGIRAGL